MFAWLGGTWEKARPFLSARWEMRMSGFLPESPASRYLPVLLGGLEVPAYHVDFADMVDILIEDDPHRMMAVFHVLNGTAPPLLRRTIATFATNARARGISSDQIQDQVEQVLQNEDLVHGLDEDGLMLAAGIPEDAWKDMRYRDKCAVAKRLKFITVTEAINLIIRPYTFRDLFFPEVSIAHGIDPYRQSQYEMKPWPIRERALIDNIKEHMKDVEAVLSPQLKTSLILRITNWCVSNEPLDLPRDSYWLPRDVVVHEELATLRTPL
jgi:hypothetical protein